MISIQSGMLVALGFLVASLLGLVLASAFWSRAVRLTTKRIKDSMPVSEPEIRADRDRLRAAYAVKVHELETRLEQAKLQRARHLIEINRRDASISALETDVVGVRSELEEHTNARRVLEQTIADRLPKVEARLAETKRLLFNRDREIAELSQGAKRHKVALEEASTLNARKSAQIDRLNVALSTRNGRGKTEPAGEGERRSEIDTLRTKTREQAMLIDRLQRRLDHGYALPAPENDAALRLAAEAEAEGVEAPATAAAAPAAAATPAATTGRPEHEREVRTLKARVEDQAGEIARLKAALAAFEESDKTGGLKNSKLALKARVGSAEAHAERQAATIGRLRSELAATHERLARQAAHFMDEMRRVGGSTPTTQGRRAADGSRRNLVDRVAQVRPAMKPVPMSAQAPAAETAAHLEEAETVPSNGHVAPVSEAKPAVTPATEGSVAEMPQTPVIPGERRKTRLLDRLTGTAKG